MVVGVLLSIIVRALSPLQNRIALRSSQEALKGLLATARVRAIEYGTRVRLKIDPAKDSAWVTADSVLTSFGFASEFNVDVQSPADSVVLCMEPRGFANPSCNSFTNFATLLFVVGSETLSVTLLPMGQIR